MPDIYTTGFKPSQQCSYQDALSRRNRLNTINGRPDEDVTCPYHSYDGKLEDTLLSANIEAGIKLVNDSYPLPRGLPSTDKMKYFSNMAIVTFHSAIWCREPLSFDSASIAKCMENDFEDVLKDYEKHVNVVKRPEGHYQSIVFDNEKQKILTIIEKAIEMFSVFNAE